METSFGFVMKNISEEFDALFEKKYKRGGKFAKYIYVGYDTDFTEPKSEFSEYLLIDELNQSMKLVKSIQEVFYFLDLTRSEINEFEKDVERLTKEAENCHLFLESQKLPTTTTFGGFRKIFVVDHEI